MGPAHRRGVGIVIAAALAVHALVWICLPTNDLHPDALDELGWLEGGKVVVSAKHPADGPVLSTLFRGLRALGYDGRAIRPVQIWSGVWMTAALAGVLFFARRSQGRWTAIGLGTALILAGMRSAVRLSVEPYLVYYAPALALMTWGLALSLGRNRGALGPDGRVSPIEWGAAIACLAVAVLFNPMVAVACPLAALLWFQSARSARRSTGVAILRALGMLIPLGVLLTFLQLLSVEKALDGPYGRWTEQTLGHVWQYFRWAMLWHKYGYTPALSGMHSVLALLVTAAYLGLPIAAAAGAALLFLTRSAAARFLPFAFAALVVALFVAWWTPTAAEFWVLPVWLVGLGVIRAAPEELSSAHSPIRRRITQIAGIVLLAEGGLVCATNVAGYVYPNATGPNLREERAERVSQLLGPEDAVVFLGWADNTLPYYAGIKSRGILNYYVRRRAGQSTFESMDMELRRTKKRRGTLYIQMPAPGQGWLVPLVRTFPKRDFEEVDFERLQLGRGFDVGSTVFREIVAIAPDH